MRTKVNIATALLYTAAFSGFALQLAGLEKSLATPVLLVMDIGIVFLGIGTLGKNRLNAAVFLLILVLSSLCYAAHDYALISHINGLREILNIVLVFSFYEALAESEYKTLFSERFSRFEKLFLLAQIPVTLYQFSLYGAGDQVGGTLGPGSSGVLTLVIILLVYRRIREQLPETGYKAYLNALYLLPLALNETKISFILIPLLFLLLIRHWQMKYAVWNIAGALIFFLVLNGLYTDQGKSTANPAAEIFDMEFLDFYLLGSDQDADDYEDLPRALKIVLAAELLDKRASDAWLGISYGVFKGGSYVDKDGFADEYHWLLSGSRPAIFYLLITGGWPLLILIIGYLIAKIYAGGDMPDRKLMILLTVLLCIMMIYNDAIRSQAFLMIYAFFALEAGGRFKTSRDAEVLPDAYKPVNARLC
ncbi:hypothetical protein [Chitinophaga sp. XS-30]|uniref:hypothetical protein n=1 Tax=Chitinophaga sp. XS-30 TaxID=2604421 RepID=UPI0011DD0D49|nr:hypothetical protein [Chitinophaga sp. XS-30]QEH41864.1 hypothetical protein FW415_13645 [Chitinophaga sp. XS-30]